MSGNVDISGVTFDVDMSGLIPALIPKLIAELETNSTFQNAIAQEILPAMRTAMLQIARTTAGTGAVTPAPGKRP